MMSKRCAVAVLSDGLHRLVTLLAKSFYGGLEVYYNRGLPVTLRTFENNYSKWRHDGLLNLPF